MNDLQAYTIEPCNTERIATLPQHNLGRAATQRESQSKSLKLEVVCLQWRSQP